MYYYIEFHDKNKKEVSSFKLWNFLSEKCNQNVELTTNRKNGFSFKVKYILQLNLLYDTFHKFFKQFKGTIYIQKSEFIDKLKKKTLRSVPIHRKRKWSEFHQVKEI